MLFQKQNLLENVFPAQWKTEFQSYFSEKLLDSARGKTTTKKKNKKNKNNYIKSFFFFNGYIKIQNGNFPTVGINKTLFILFVLFCLCYI